jgi:hypothetical protein
MKSRLKTSKSPLIKRFATATSVVALLAGAPEALAFCGFFVAKGDAELFNEASKVVMVRDGNRTVITMVNDFQGDASDFAMVVPAPTVLQREQIHVTENAVVEHLDAYSAPRLVEYFDPDPCQPIVVMERMMTLGAAGPQATLADGARNRALGVTVEAQYLVGEYDILILSATQSDGLETWLKENDYSVPDGASEVLGSYIGQGMKFFVAKVNLEEHAKQGGGLLRPLQIAFESPKFILPIRLGMLNSKGSQDLLLYTLTRKGRVETANYRTVRMPTDAEIPVMTKDRFGQTYKALYGNSVDKEGGAAVMMEYAWDMNWCDPCAADPLSAEELRELGVFWVDPASAQRGQGSAGCMRATIRKASPRICAWSRPATTPTSRAATSCATHSAVKWPARRASSTASRSRSALSARLRRWPA